MSANMRPQVGPAMIWVISTTLSPVSGPRCGGWVVMFFVPENYTIVWLFADFSIKRFKKT
jgi:hypothetical protein